jgi:hypothetical protein
MSSGKSLEHAILGVISKVYLGSVLAGIVKARRGHATIWDAHKAHFLDALATKSAHNVLLVSPLRLK